LRLDPALADPLLAVEEREDPLATPGECSLSLTNEADKIWSSPVWTSSAETTSCSSKPTKLQT